MTTIHIVFGMSASGSLRHFLKNKKAEDHAIYTIEDDLSYGPLQTLPEREKHLEELFMQTSSSDFPITDYREFVAQLTSTWPKAVDFQSKKAVVWHSPNIREQLGLRLVASVLTDYELYEIDLSKVKTQGRATAEYTPNELGSLIGTETLISSEKRKILVKEWHAVCTANSPIRIWDEDTVQNVTEDYYDQEILNACTNERQPAARVVGNVLGESAQVVSDILIHHRLKRLIVDGKISYAGSPDSMRTYSVWLTKC